MSQEVVTTGRSLPRPERLVRSPSKGWRLPEGAVYVGPGSRWDVRRFVHWCRPVWLGDKFEINDPRWPAAGLRLYMDMRTEVVLAARKELAGRDLACWCEAQDPNCHAEVLLAVANSPVKPWPAPAPSGAG